MAETKNSQFLVIKPIGLSSKTVSSSETVRVKLRNHLDLAPKSLGISSEPPWTQLRNHASDIQLMAKIDLKPTLVYFGYVRLAIEKNQEVILICLRTFLWPPDNRVEFCHPNIPYGNRNLLNTNKINDFNLSIP